MAPAGAVDHRPAAAHAGAGAARLDLSNIADLMSDPGRNPMAMKLGIGTALVLTLLLSPLLTGAVASAARASGSGGGSSPAMRDLFAGAVAEYPRMFRMLLWAVVPLGAALGFGNALQQMAGSGADGAITPDQGQFLRVAADAVAALLFGLALATLLLSMFLPAWTGWQFAPAAALLGLVLAYPLWSWRRLSAATQFLRAEIEHLQREAVAHQGVQGLRQHFFADTAHFAAQLAEARLVTWLSTARDGQAAAISSPRRASLCAAREARKVLGSDMVSLQGGGTY
eukprot:gene30249-37431_t